MQDAAEEANVRCVLDIFGLKDDPRCIWRLRFLFGRKDQAWSKRNAERLLDALRSLREPLNEASRGQVIQLQGEANQQRTLIQATEAEMNAELFDLYGLSAEERALILRG